MTTKVTPEQRISRAMRPLLELIPTGARFEDDCGVRDVLVGLEYFLPAILADVYPYWKGESLDGFYLSEARKTGFYRAEMRGVCILISDQTITPFHVRMQIAASSDKINWMECRLGKRGNGNGEMERIPWSRWQGHSYSFLQDSLKPIDWTYQVAFGEESHPA